MNEDNFQQDKTLLKKLFKSLRPLKHDKVILRPPPKKIRASTTPPEEQFHQALSSADKIFYTNRPLPRKALQQFKKGQYNPEDVLDLHGMTVAEAKIALDKFIQESYEANYFVVAVIHGKGRHKSEKPILKNKVNEWLREYASVMACCSALNKDGGTGKVYIMLESSR